MAHRIRYVATPSLVYGMKEAASSESLVVNVGMKLKTIPLRAKMIIHKLEEAPEYDLIYADPPWQQHRGAKKRQTK